jgi:hypothetical protein
MNKTSQTTKEIRTRWITMPNWEAVLELKTSKKRPYTNPMRNKPKLHKSEVEHIKKLIALQEEVTESLSPKAIAEHYQVSVSIVKMIRAGQYEGRDSD